MLERIKRIPNNIVAETIAVTGNLLGYDHTGMFLLHDGTVTSITLDKTKEERVAYKDPSGRVVIGGLSHVNVLLSQSGMVKRIELNGPPGSIRMTREETQAYIDSHPVGGCGGYM